MEEPPTEGKNITPGQERKDEGASASPGEGKGKRNASVCVYACMHALLCLLYYDILVIEGKKAVEKDLKHGLKVRVKLLSRVRPSATPWTVAYQASPSMGFSRQEYWSGLPFPSPGDLPDPGIEPASPSL